MKIKFSAHPLFPLFIFVSFCWNAILADKTLFSPGKEYTYLYETLVTTGTEEPISYASAYRLKGNLRIQAISNNVVNIKLDDLTVGLYNGPWSYFPIPNFQQKTSAELNSLTDPFQLQTENGKFKALMMNDQEPEYASNMKRGIATYLQMDLKTVNFDKVGLSKIPELTTMGECDTQYEILPVEATKVGLSRISKYRNHAGCPDVQTRTRYSTKIFHACPDKQTRNILNSTAYATYAIDSSDPEKLTIRQVVVFSSVLYWPFTVKAPYLYTWLNMTLALTNVGPITNPIPAPENSENHEDLNFVFEQNDLNDPEEEVQEFRSAEPYLFHHTAGDSDPEVLQGIMEQLHKTTEQIAQSLTENNNWSDVDNFHKNSPFALIPLIASLDYESLKHCYQRYSEGQTSKGVPGAIEFQLFLDGIILAGNWPSTLTVRDVLVSTEDTKIWGRIVPSFPHFIRNPTEALAKELEKPLFELTRKTTVSKNLRRMLELSLASFISKCCQKSLCTTSGLLDKYTKHFQDMLTLEKPEAQTVGVLGLRNLGIGKSLDKLLEIAQGKVNVARTVRVQAIWSLRPLAYVDRETLFSNLLPVFYNRAESCEVRTSVFSFLISCYPDQKVLHEIAYYMWTETCPQTLNNVRSTLTTLANTKHPCNPSQEHARTILKYLPPGAVDPTKTASYAVDYYDEDHGFGHMTSATVQKSGKTALPVSIYIGLDAFIGGFATSYLGVYIRMQGLGKTVTDKLASLRSANVEDIQSILTKIGVKERSGTPLFLELVIIYHGKVIGYLATDELDGVNSIARTLGDMRMSFTLDWQRSIMVGGVLYQQPMEIGVPISVLSSVTGIGVISSRISRGAAGGLMSQENNLKLQFHAFGLTRVANHLPGLGTTHSITSQRTLRLALPAQFTLGLDIKNKAIKIEAKPVTGTNPIIAIAHAETRTGLSADSLSLAKELRITEILKETCPTCTGSTIVSRGKAFRNSRTRDFKHPLVPELKASFKYFDCERDHSRKSTLQKFRHIFDPRSKNLGIFGNPVTSSILHLHQARDAIFYSPQPGSCGVALSFTQDGNEVEKIDGQLRGSIDPLNSKLSLEYSAAIKHATSSSDVKFESFISHEQENLDVQKFTVKVVVSQGGNDKVGVACMDVNINANDIPKDLLCFQGENEPFIKQSVSLKLGKITKSQVSGKTTPCSTDRADILLTMEARQSNDQKNEAKQDIYPYKMCRDQKKSSLYPGTRFVPPTTECHLSVTQQTKLRHVNVSLNYNVNQEVRNRWRRPLGLLEGFFQSYYLDAESVTDNQVTSHSTSTTSGTYSGEIQLDMDLNDQAPTANVHYHSHGGSNSVEEHFHDIELNLLPDILTPKPIPSRFSPLLVTGVKLGAFGVCSVTPQVVHTFDGASIASPLSDCLTLVSAECGKNPQFAILAKKLTAETIGLLIHIGDTKIELDGGVSNVKVNGQAKTLPDRVNQDLPSSIQALKNGEEIYISTRVDGINVRYTGNFVTITLGSRYRSTQCGLCGSFDSSPYNDLTGPDLQCSKPLSPAQFFQSYVLPGGQCKGTPCPA